MITGTLIAESLRLGAELTEVPLRVTEVWRGGIDSPAKGQPAVWTVLDFEAEEPQAEPLGAALSDALGA